MYVFDGVGDCVVVVVGQCVGGIGGKFVYFVCWYVQFGCVFFQCMQYDVVVWEDQVVEEMFFGVDCVNCYCCVDYYYQISLCWVVLQYMLVGIDVCYEMVCFEVGGVVVVVGYVIGGGVGDDLVWCYVLQFQLFFDLVVYCVVSDVVVEYVVRLWQVFLVVFGQLFDVFQEYGIMCECCCIWLG